MRLGGDVNVIPDQFALRAGVSFERIFLLNGLLDLVTHPGRIPAAGSLAPTASTFFWR